MKQNAKSLNANKAYKYIVVSISVSILLIILFVLVILIKQDAPAKTVLQVAWGAKKGELGFVSHSEGIEDQGPTSFFVAGHEEIYILDTVNRRINKYIKGNFVQDIKLQTKYYPHDILVNKDSIYVLTDMTIERIDISGKVISSAYVKTGDTSILSNSWQVYMLSDRLIVLFDEGFPPQHIKCFDTKLNATDCRNIDKLFRTYGIIDLTPDGYLVLFDDDWNLNLLTQEGKVIKKSKLSSYKLISAELYPRVRSLRVVANKIYTIVPSNQGIIFDEYEL